MRWRQINVINPSYDSWHASDVCCLTLWRNVNRKEISRWDGRGRAGASCVLRFVSFPLSLVMPALGGFVCPSPMWK